METKKLNVVQMKISEIKVYENNPRDNDGAVEAVANSIKSFGFKVPIIVDSNNVIIAGHTRLKASKRLGLTEVPVIVADDLTEDQIKAFRLADNKTSELASWDLDKLTEELRFIEMDMEQFGFEDLEALLDDGSAEDDGFNEDEALPENPFSRKGDVFILGKHRLMCGDSTKVEDIQKLTDGKKMDFLLCDPPYGVDYSNDAGSIENDDLKEDEFIEFLTNAFKAADSVLKDGACFDVWYADCQSYCFYKAIHDIGWKLSQMLIWKKDSLVLSRKDFHSIHEPCMYGWKLGAAHNYYNDRKQTTVMEYPKPKHNDLHPTMKPLELFGYQIKNSSKKNDNVMDTFSGSGTTLICCEQLDRNGFCMELDEKYVDVIVKRYIRYVQSYDNCYLIRDGVKISLKDIEDYHIDFDDSILE